MNQDFNKDVNKKLNLFTSNSPYFYIKLSHCSNTYRISLNYEFLNKTYGLKLKFIRNLSKIHQQYNKYFNINNKIVLFNKDVFHESSEIIISDDNKIIINKIIIDGLNNNDKTSLFIFKRIYKNDINYSILFCSTVNYTLDEFLNV